MFHSQPISRNACSSRHSQCTASTQEPSQRPSHSRGAPACSRSLRAWPCAGPTLLLPLLALLLLGTPHPAAGNDLDIDTRIRNHWKELVAICPNRNYTSCNGVDRSGWTDASRSQFEDFKFNGLGKWSTFKITTVDFRGKVKTKGGDSWYVVLRDRQQRLKVPTRIFDNGDGEPGLEVWGCVGWVWAGGCEGGLAVSVEGRGGQVRE